MEHNTITKELLSRNKNILRALNQSHGFNFEKPMLFAKIDGRFTHNTVKKLLNIETSKSTTALIMCNIEYREKYNYIVTMYNDGFGLSLPRRVSIYSCLDYFWRKSDFEDARKNSRTITYIISQDKKYITPEKTSDFDYELRYKLINHTKGAYPSRGYNYISQLDLLHPYTGRKFTYRTGVCMNEPNIYAYIDKSGYVIIDKKRDLLAKARDLKAQREKQKASQLDFSGTIAILDNTIEQLKKETSKKLEKCATFDDFSKLTSYLRQIEWLVMDIDRFKRNANEKSFISIDSANSKLDSIYKRINEIKTA